MKTWMIALAALLPLAAHAAPAPPPDDAYAAWRCGDGSLMADAQADDPDFLGDLDLVGTDTAPAALRAGDDDFLYLRIRLDADPAPGGVPNPGGVWGVAFDLDGDSTDYELLIVADATPASPVVTVRTNRTVTVPNSPLDPADAPPAATYTFRDAASARATSTTFGGTPDYFLDLAIPWADLEPLGLTPTSSVRVWVASSSLPDALDGDFACHAAGSGAVVLDTSASRRGDGGGPRLEGGGGCRATGGAGLLAGLVAIALAARRRSRRSS
ncbi:MAG: hypothetical protein KF773_31840 [Deltaproteobacteria bacterium]|nr:hypothetical protein [Deltaproteobacteria bacterium]MCW5807324.1 hypothetical protein [Deltaproteobacteria bacterium]